MAEISQPQTNAGSRPTDASFWPHGWWRIMETRIGIIPLPIYAIMILLIWGFYATGKVPSDILMAIALLTVGGFTCAEIGKHLPVVRRIGAAILWHPDGHPAKVQAGFRKAIK